MGIGRGRLRFALAVLVLLCVPVGLYVGVLWQLLVCVVLVSVVTYVEDYVLGPKREMQNTQNLSA